MTGDVLISGDVNSINSRIGGSLNAKSLSIHLEDSIVHDIYVRKTASGLPQVVVLKGMTTVLKDITFESGQGEIICSPGTKLGGSVIGGTLCFESSLKSSKL